MKLFLLTICLLTVSFCKAQFSYYDALELNSIFSKSLTYDSFNEATKILANYLPDRNLNDQQIQAIYLSNPFIPDSYKNFVLGSSSPIIPTKIIAKNIGGLNVTNFADGLAKFLVERTKTELSVYFFQRFKKDLNDSEELQKLFPSTLKVLNTIDQEIYIYEAYLNTLREAFVKDMMNFYENFQAFSKLPRYQAYFNTYPELKTTLEVGFYLINQYSKGVHPGEVLAKLDTAKIKMRDKKLETTIRNGVGVAKLFSESLRAKGDSTYWISEKEIEALWKDSLLLNIYLGLVYEKGKDIYFKKGSDSIGVQYILASLKVGAGNLKDSLEEYKHFIKTIHQDALEVEGYMNSIGKKGKSERDYNDYYLFYGASIDLIQDGFLFFDLPYVNLGSEAMSRIKEQSEKWINVARAAGDLYVDVRTKNYASAVLSAVNILDEVVPEKNPYKSEAKSTVQLPDELKKLEKNKKELTTQKLEELKKQYSEKIMHYLDSLVATRDADYFKNLREQILKYGTFASAVAQAKNSDEVKAAIESIALPSGSSLIKRETSWNIAVNGYVGLFLGNEDIKGVEGDQGKVNAYGVTAPVGITFSKGHSFLFIPTGKCGFSTSLMISAIDLGTVVSYRFRNDSVSAVPDIKLQDIFSPGAFLSLGIPKCPISVNLGAQIGPNLRKVYATSTANDVSEAIYVRLSGAICVDIPLLNLYTRSRK